MLYSPRVMDPVEAEPVMLNGSELTVVAIDGRAHAIPSEVFDLFFEATPRAEKEMRRRMAGVIGTPGATEAPKSVAAAKPAPPMESKIWNGMGLNPEAKIKPAPANTPHVTRIPSAQEKAEPGIGQQILAALLKGPCVFSDLCERLPELEPGKISSNFYSLRISKRVDRDDAGVLSITDKGREQCK